MRVLDLLRARGDRVTFVRGNADREVAHALDRDADDPGKKWHGQSRWVAQQLNPEQRAWLGGLPTTTTIEIDWPQARRSSATARRAATRRSSHA